MKTYSRYTIIVFVLVGISLIILYINKERLSAKKTETVQAKLVIPTNLSENNENKSGLHPIEVERLTTYIQLLNDEIVQSVQSIDINFDTFEDQIVAIRKSGKENLFLLVGLYNQSNGLYERTALIDTEIKQLDTFSFSVMDVIGNHTNALIFSGAKTTSQTTLKIYLVKIAKDTFELDKIADFSTDGNVFIQQVPRSEAYELNQATGVSLPVYVMTADTSENASSLDQIQKVFHWNSSFQQYEKISETKITGKKITASELAKIQDGKVGTFESFLNGLWFKTNEKESIPRYIFFNLPDKEIIFLANDTQEVYLWQNSVLRRNGLYLSSVNNSISNLTRRFDIALSSIDEIKIKISDDVKMVIGEETLWDGSYRKWTERILFSTDDNKEFKSFDKLNITNNQPWMSLNNKKLIMGNNHFEIIDGANKASGALAVMQIQDKYFLQFRNFSGQPVLSGYYQVSYDIEKNGNAIKELLTLTPSTVSTNGSFLTGDVAVTYERIIQ